MQRRVVGPKDGLAYPLGIRKGPGKRPATSLTMAASLRIRIVNPNVTNSERDVGRPTLPGLGGRLLGCCTKRWRLLAQGHE